MAFAGCSNVFRSPRHDLHGIVGQGRCSAFAWSYWERADVAVPTVVRFTGTLDGCCPRQTRRGEPAGRKADEPQRACDPVAAGLLPVPVVEAGALTISATAWLSGSAAFARSGCNLRSKRHSPDRANGSHECALRSLYPGHGLHT